jgi:drug/metabolite transporter (DMT)-like permease
MKASVKNLDRSGLLNLLVVYIVWSSTYLAIRLAVREGAGFPPFSLGFMRAIVGALILLAWAYFRKENIRPKKREWFILAQSGVLLWLGGNGLVTFAETRVESGLAALMVAAIPIWSTILESLLDRQLPSRQLAFSLLIGFSGIGILTLPGLRTGIRADAIAMFALIGATLTWSIGSVLQARNPVKLSNRVNAGYQMLFGAIAFGVVALLLGEARPTPTAQAWGAYVYLVIFGSVFAFTAYVTALQRLPTRIVMTYAYVNPVLAVLLGWVVLNEEITAWTIGGSLFVLLGVTGVFRERFLAKDETK